MDRLSKGNYAYSLAWSEISQSIKFGEGGVVGALFRQPLKIFSFPTLIHLAALHLHMSKDVRALIFSLLIAFSGLQSVQCNAQQFDPTPYSLISKGDSLFRRQEYRRSIEYYLEALRLRVIPSRDVYYAIAIGFDHLGEDSLAGHYLNLSVHSGLGFYNMESFHQDKKLKRILQQSGNESAYSMLETNTFNFENSDSLCLRSDLRDELLRRKGMDQQFRKSRNQGSDFTGQKNLDGNNQLFLDSLLSAHGKWPGYAEVGRSGESAAALIAIHAEDTLFQKHALALMEVELDKGNIYFGNYALLLDKVMMSRESKQVFGTQVFYDPTSRKAIPHELKFPEMVDTLRELFECVPLKEYLDQMSN